MLFVKAEASLPKYSTGLFGCFVSSVSTPINLTFEKKIEDDKIEWELSLAVV